MTTSDQLIIYVDESGNTGDINENTLFDWHKNEQNFFVLGGFAQLPNQNELPKRMTRILRDDNKISAKELKSKNLYPNKNRAVLQALEMLLEEDCPIFIELTDKVYFLCSQITNIIFWTNLYIEDSMQVTEIQDCADYLYNCLPSELVWAFCQLCNDRNGYLFHSFFNELTEFLLPRNFECFLQLQKLSALFSSNWEEMCKRSLPTPDFLPSGKQLNSLPHIPSLFSICTRAAKYAIDSNIPYIECIHDSLSLPIWNVLTDNMSDVGKISPYHNLFKTEWTVMTDWDLSRTVIKQANSKETDGIQIADILSGYVFRTWKNFMGDDATQISNIDQSIWELLINKFPQETTPSGVNFVVPGPHLEAFMTYVLNPTCDH